MDAEAHLRFQDAVDRCLHALRLYLMEMAALKPSRPEGASGRGAEGGVLETSMHGTRYGLRFLCGVGRLERILVVMDSPYRKQFMVGRLEPNGALTLYRSGALLLVGYLVNEGLLEVFQSDLDESLALSALPGKAFAPRS